MSFFSEALPHTGDRFAVAVSTTFDVPGTEVERYCGSVFGVVVRSVGFAKGFTAGFRALAGGEVKGERRDRDALDSSEIGQQPTEIVACGTAFMSLFLKRVRVDPNDGSRRYVPE